MAASLEEQCVTAFKQCNHDVAIQLLPQLQDPAALTTEFKIFGKLSTNVSLLHLAAYHGWLHIIKIVRKCSYRDCYGNTPLHYAAARNNVTTIAYLITTLKYDPRTLNKYNILPIHIACLNGHLSVTKYLITEQRCNPKCRGQYGRTPLHYACEDGHMNIIQYLITELGCDPKNRDNDGALPLHIACRNGHLSITKYLITEQHCNPKCRGQYGWTPLHYACDSGHMNIIQYLITEQGCDPKTPDNIGALPLHIACLRDHLSVTKYLITEQHCDPKCRDKYGWTPLHYASKDGHMNIIYYLITEQGCDPKIRDYNSALPLRIACFNGHLSVTKYLITELHCDPKCRGQYGRTPLHYACDGGHMNIIQYLITKQGCDPKTPDNIGHLPLHIACLNGHLSATKYLITEQHCNPKCRGQYGWTPLHYASLGGHMNIIQYLITEQGCDPVIVDIFKATPLHIATFHGHTDIVRWLLHDGRIDIMAKNSSGKTCINLARQGKNSYQLLELFQPLIKLTKLFPIHRYGKTVLTGDSGAGKTTLAKVITERSNTYLNRLRSGNVQQVEGHTAGIVPSHVESWEVGKMTLFDLAGQAEYHSSHSAIMETVMQQSPATFINVVDLSNSGDEIKQQLHYWLNFIDSATSKAISKSCLIVVGSHADLLSKDQFQSKSAFITNLVQRRVARPEFMGFVTMDCRKIDAAGTREFISLLDKSQQVIVARAPSMSYYCHLLYAFLHSKAGLSFLTFEELKCEMLIHEDSLIPNDSSLYIELLTALNDKGMIIFLKNQHQIEKCWIVVDIVGLLKTIDGVLFAPKHFKEHCNIVCNTGIILSSSLKILFPQYNLEMLVSFLHTLELCHRVNLSGISTNIQSIGASMASGDAEQEDCFLFFPSLLAIHQPNRPCSLLNEGKFSFGWCLCCLDQENQFFTSRFLHVLLLRLAYTFPLACESSIVSPPNQRQCTVWTNGIFWDNEEGISTVVELIDHNQRLVVMMSHRSGSRPVECSKHRSAVIRLILDLQQEFCSNVETAEYLISCSLLPVDKVCPSDNDLLPIKNVARSMLLHTPYILNSAGNSSDQSTEEIISFEPYYQLSPSSVYELMDSSKADELVSQSLLDEVKTRCQLPQLELQSHSCLRKCIDELSMFSGRNILVSQ